MKRLSQHIILMYLVAWRLKSGSTRRRKQPGQRDRRVRQQRAATTRTPSVRTGAAAGPGGTWCPPRLIRHQGHVQHAARAGRCLLFMPTGLSAIPYRASVYQACDHRLRLSLNRVTRRAITPTASNSHTSNHLSRGSIRMQQPQQHQM